MGDIGIKELEEEISEVAIDGSNIFISWKMEEYWEQIPIESQDEKKFKFAHFVAGTLHGDRLFALEKQGYLIVTNRNFTKRDVYRQPEID